MFPQFFLGNKPKFYKTQIPEETVNELANCDGFEIATAIIEIKHRHTIDAHHIVTDFNRLKIDNIRK